MSHVLHTTVSRGRRGAGSGLCRALEEVTALYSWDRPALFSPIKTGAKYEVRFGNSVFVVTRLPADSDQLHQFLDSAGGKQVKPRDILESISSKRVKATFTGELNISLHIINAVEGPIEGNVVQVENFHFVTCLFHAMSFQLFHKALKDLKGGVLQLSSLGSFSLSREESRGSFEPLVQKSRDLGHVPATCVLASHVLESSLPGKLVDRSHYGRGEVRLQDTSLQLEFVSSCDLGLAGVAALGLVEVSSVTSLASSCWRQWACVWAADHGTTLTSVLAFLHHTGQCLVLEVGGPFVRNCETLTIISSSGPHEADSRHVPQLRLHRSHRPDGQGGVTLLPSPTVQHFQRSCDTKQ